MSIIDKIERVLFGATAEEAVEMRLKLIDQRVEQRLQRLVDAFDQDEDTTAEDEAKKEARG